MKIQKIITALVLAVVLAVSASISTFAALPDTPSIEPQWESIGYTSLNTTFDGTSGNSLGVAAKKSTATSIEGTLTVYKQVGSSWVFVGSDSGSKTTVSSLILSVDFVCQSGVTYKSIMTITGYTGTSAESETFEVVKTCP